MRNKKKFTIYGNCQAPVLAGTLLAYQNFKEQFEYVELSPCFLGNKKEMQTWVEKNLGQLDFILSQNLKPGWRDNNSTWDLSYLSKTLKKEGKLYRYNEFYYRGVNPFFVYPKSFTRFQHCDYLDLVSLTLYSLGFNDPSMCVELYQTTDLLTTSEIKAIQNLSNFELINREKSVDIKLSTNISSRCKESPAFLTFNHPKRQILDILATEFFEQIQFEPGEQINGDTELLNSVRFPLPASIRNDYQHRGYAFDKSQDDIATVNLEGDNQGITLAEYFEKNLQALSQLGIVNVRNELESQKTNSISALVISAIEKHITKKLNISVATLTEIGCLNQQDITPDFLLTKANPQAMGFMSDLVSFMRNLLLPKHMGEHFSVLDLGAKTAVGSEFLANLGHPASFSKLKFSVTCADIDTTFQTYSNLANPHVEYLCEDAFKTGRTWDIVICSHVIEHVDNPLEFINNLKNIANKFIILAFPYSENAGELIEGHLHSLNHNLLRELKPSRYEIYEGLFWSQSLCCIAAIEI